MAHHTPVTADFQTPEAAGNSYGNANVSGPAKVIFGNVYLGSGSQGDIALDPVQATQGKPLNDIAADPKLIPPSILENTVLS